MSRILPQLWLLIFIIGLPILSESAYSPSLPDIAKTLNTSNNNVEQTLTLYILGFALGVLWWGKMSDFHGRKPCAIMGFLVYILGCILCYLSTSIEMLFCARLIQGFGGGAGSVLGQSIVRDAFHGKSGGKTFSVIATALPIFPMIGPAIGGLIAHHYGWRDVFMFLCICGVLLIGLVFWLLPETLPHEDRTKTSILGSFRGVLKDYHILKYTVIVGGQMGLIFSYLAEAPFIMIKIFGMLPQHYGYLSLVTASAAIIGGRVSYKLQTTRTPFEVMKIGLNIFFLGGITLLLMSFLIMHFNYGNTVSIILILISMTIIFFSIAIFSPNALFLALNHRKTSVGTISAIFGFIYYIFASIFTYIMGMLHNGTLTRMPCYFFVLTLTLLIIGRCKTSFDEKLEKG